MTWVPAPQTQTARQCTLFVQSSGNDRGLTQPEVLQREDRAEDIFGFEQFAGSRLAIHQTHHADDLGACFLDGFDRLLRAAAGRQNIIDNHDAAAGDKNPFDALFAAMVFADLWYLLLPSV